MLLAVAIVASLFAGVITRGGITRRGPAALVPLILWTLAAQPHVPWLGTAPAVLESAATLAEIEDMLRGTAAGSTIEVRGDGLHPEFLPLLDERIVTWQAPTAQLGLAALSWPRRVAVGEPVLVRGRIDLADSLTVRLVAPDGHVDSVRTDSSFALRIVPRAAGRWQMQLIVRDDTIALGVHVIPPPRLRVLVIAGRPDFEVPALVRRLVAQGADVTVRTQLTRDQRRIERHGLTPPEPRLTETMLDSLDLVVLGAGGIAAVTASEARTLAAAVGRGLGLLHLVETPVSIGTITPFALRSTGAERAIRLSLDGAVWPGSVRAAPLVGPDSLAYLRDSAAIPVAWKVSVGNGVVAGTSMTQAHRLSLAGHPESEATWWSSLLGPVLRKPTARWSVADDVLVRANEPVTLTWSGAPDATVSVIEADTVTEARLLQASGDGPPTLRLWPRDSGWISVTAGKDTLALLVAPGNALEGMARGIRHEAMAAIARPAGDPAPIGRVPMPRWFGWLLLVGALVLAWRPR